MAELTGLIITAEPNSPFITITRDFAAPPELVFRAFTDPDLLVHWLGPAKYEMKIDKHELRDGGSWRYLHVDPDTGDEFGFKGVFHGEPSIENGITQTWEWEGLPGHVSLERMQLEAIESGTRWTSLAVYQSIADRDGLIANGMEYGLREGCDRLDGVLAGILIPS